MCFIKDIPDNHGISSKAILDFLEEIESVEEINITNFILLKDKYILAEFCRKPYEKDSMQLLFSLTKSFSSLGIGIAVDKGYLSLGDKVISFFPERLPEVINDNLGKMTIQHLLTMTAGIHDNTYEILYPQKDWIKAFLAQDFPHEPGTYYRYSTHGSHMLSAIIEKATGESLLDFLDKHLFKLLSIPKPQWETCPMGTTAGGMGLSLAPESIAKIGMLLLNKGKYLGKRIISEEYIKAATTPQVSKQKNNDDIHTKKYSGFQYGYQFHIGLDDNFRADGAFGQLCLVVPKDELIIVATSRGSNTEKLLELIYKQFLKNNYKDKLFDPVEYNALNRKLSTMEYPIPTFKNIPEGIPKLKNSCYAVSENSNQIVKIVLNQKDKELNLKIVYCNDRCSNLQFDFTRAVHGKDIFIKDIQFHEQKYVSYAKWIDKAVLELIILYIETPYVVTYSIAFFNEEIKIDFKINVSLSLKNFIACGELIDICKMDEGMTE
jgi:CubicO group peptidase (beta-lactamase class C family)